MKSLLAVAALCLLGIPAIADVPPSYILQWGSEGTAPGQFRSAHGVAVDAAGFVYVADRMNVRIQKFGADGNYITQWPSHGPEGVAIHPNGSVYAAIRVDNKIEIYTNDGQSLGAWGATGSGPGQFDLPHGIAIDTDGSVYVVDKSPRVQKFGSFGNYVLQWGSGGFGDGQFHAINGVATDGKGHVYVSDGTRIQKFTTSGTFLAAWPIGGQSEFLTCDGSGNVLVTDSTNDNVQIYSPDGNLITSFGGCCEGDGEFIDPQGVAVSGSGYIYVAESLDGHNGNDRVQKFGFVPTAAIKRSWGELKTRYR